MAKDYPQKAGTACALAQAVEAAAAVRRARDEAARSTAEADRMEGVVRATGEHAAAAEAALLAKTEALLAAQAQMSELLVR